MADGTPEEFRRLVAEKRLDHAIALLRWLDPLVAADAFMSIPFGDQQQLFHTLPIDLAATLVESLPYYHAYVLLRQRPPDEVRAILDSMNSLSRVQFFEELTADAWKQLVEEAPRAVPRAPAIIEAIGIEKVFRQPDGGLVQVLGPIDLVLPAGMIVAVLGPSGSGKSTLLRILAGLIPASNGEVQWHGKRLQEAVPRVGIVFQSFALFPWLTVQENVEVPLIARGVGRDERQVRSLRTLESVGLKGFENAYPKELSGGMKQRVGFARALAVEPEILFMDEPFSALDVLTAENLRGELMELWLAHRIPTQSIFLVTHNIEEAVLLADRIVVLGRHPAQIRADFEVSIRQPRARHSHEFLLYVDYIYKLMTQPLIEAGPVTVGAQSRGALQPLPAANQGSIAGFLELLNSRGGREDLYRIAGDLQMEVDDLLPIVEAASLLRFAKSERGDVEITSAGKAFAEADISSRKRLFREAVVGNVALLQHMESVLLGKPDHTMPLEFFRDVLRKRASDAEVEQQIETALNWGRYGDLLAYDVENDRLSLHEASAAGEPGDRRRLS